MLILITDIGAKYTEADLGSLQYDNEFFWES